jgi:hypothetical protein
MTRRLIWFNRSHNFVLVLGSFNGSVFQVAATANNVSCGPDSCVRLTEETSRTLPLRRWYSRTWRGLHVDALDVFGLHARYMIIT